MFYFSFLYFPAPIFLECSDTAVYEYMIMLPTGCNLLAFPNPCRFGSYMLFGLDSQKDTPWRVFMPRMGYSFPSPDSLSFRHVCCLCHPLQLAFPTPCCVSCRPAVTILQQQQQPYLANPKPTYLHAHHGPQAQDGPGPQRARPLLHVWGQHALRDQGVPRKVIV